MAVEIELRQRTDAKPWYCEVYVRGLPLLDARGNVVTVTKNEIYRSIYSQDHWMRHVARSHGGEKAKDITPVA